MPAPPPATLFARACRGEATERIPVWLMRQAGRYLPAYQALKRDVSFKDLCRKPELAAQATLDAARYLGTDAAIIFSDITVVAEAMGLPLVFDPGPKLTHPVRCCGDIEALRVVAPARDLAYVLEAVRRTRAQLAPEVSLIGFCGAPFTLAAYMIEGDPGHGWLETKRLVYGSPELAASLIDKVTDAIIAHAPAQVEAGCDAIQLFDSNAGELGSPELEQLAFAAARRAVGAIRSSGAPVIYFARNIGAHLEAAAGIGADVLGLDWTVSIAEVRRRLGARPALQGNLDPAVLLTSSTEIKRRVHSILGEAQGHGGFIFNLGHGVLPGTPPEAALQVVETVHAWKAR
jgi:uroporphyrinogen decarboxylase